MAPMDDRIKANRAMDRAFKPDCEAFFNPPDLCPNKATYRCTYGEYEYAIGSLLCDLHTRLSLETAARMTDYPDTVFRTPL